MPWSWPTLLAAVAAGGVVSPLAAGWSAALADGQRSGWWRLRPVSGRRWVTVAAVIAGLVVLAAAGSPSAAWWLFAVGGAVLAVVDAQIAQLPARFTYPLAAAVGAALVVAATTEADPGRLLHAALAAVVVGGCWLAVCLASPRSTGLGDVRLATLTAAILGWSSWADVGQGLLLTTVLAGLTAVLLRVSGRAGSSGRRVTVPMGPSLIVGTLLALWL